MSPDAMRFLADESCDFAVVRALRLAGHDALAITEMQRRSDDSEVISLAARDQRILLTEDKDFGWLVFASHVDSPGVILIRFPGDVRETLGLMIVQLAQVYGKSLIGSFVVVQPGHIRISRKSSGVE